ncbi:MAG: hypothetical protein AVDCRST_MAG89-5394, partial [uncultured Gemmatimonadetes bacterium]
RRAGRAGDRRLSRILPALLPGLRAVPAYDGGREPARARPGPPGQGSRPGRSQRQPMGGRGGRPPGAPDQRRDV